jgi:multidrug efflux system membrane fusion protein
MSRRTVALLLCACLWPAGVTGCTSKQGPPPAPEVPVIPVSKPVEREVTEYVDYTGRTDAIDSVGIRPRVSGYLVNIPFKEGSEVKKGDLLFEIDPAPYQALYDQAQAQVALNQASLRFAQSVLARDKAIGTGGVSSEQLEQDQAAVVEAQARIKASQAALETYRLNLGFTKVRSPINGQVGRYYLTLGNLAVADQTLLTTVVSLDPIHAYFDIDEPTLERVRRSINQGKLERRGVGNIPVYMGLQTETGFPRQGVVNFANPVVNPSTGTLALRGQFANPKPADGVRELSPGMFVRIRLPIGRPQPALLVVDRAVGSDQGLRFVYVVNAQNQIEYRRVTVGPLEEDGLRVIQSGITKDDRVVIGGLLQVRPRMTVQPEDTAMPTFPVEGQAPGAQGQRPQPPPPGGNRQPQRGDNQRGGGGAAGRGEGTR